MTHHALHRPFAPAIISADFKTYPTDFIVKELMTVDFSGQGEHLWVHVCKVGMNTAFVAKLLADWAGIAMRDVGYSGLKDRHAQTYQWFSLRLPKRGMPALEFDECVKNHLKEGESLTLIAHHWHDKKLHRGTHKANAFTITLRQVAGEISAINAQLTHIKQAGRRAKLFWRATLWV
ncbi:tRNA pseudouridine(13) synthase TruD [Moraxella bovis]|uniref:tRNA pseudouridine(13) synthase TruD n=1 Tax=Moraxella bovis TaxID=476 RepID=UPI001D17B385|nr:tRNA pseudouridine(13) synthase TruD [Moraxella bovis]